MTSATGARALLIVNADDWGIDSRTTDAISDCVDRGAVTAVSAMVFMADSERSAELARQHSVDTGLHINLTALFTAACPSPLLEHQRRVAAYLRSTRMAQVVFNPLLAQSFQYVVKAQIEEYERLYRSAPMRLDGHHHMHLSANVVCQRLMPAGTVARRNFHFEPGEKGAINRVYRRLIDSSLKRRHTVIDRLYSIKPLMPMDRLDRIFNIARREVIELETHPINADEHEFLVSGQLLRRAGDAVRLGRFTEVFRGGLAPASSFRMPLKAGDSK